MLIREWMTRNVISVTPETSMFKASRLMKENNIRRLPVMGADGKLIGIISDRDIRTASPSKATTLDMHELYYLLSEVKVKDIMTRQPVTILETETVDTAAVVMDEKEIGGLPVMSETGELVGIITDRDVFKVLIDVCGARKGGLLLGFHLPDQPGVLCPIFDSLRDLGANVLSVLTSRSRTEDGSSHVFFRLHPTDPVSQNKILEGMKQYDTLVYWVDDTYHTR